MLTIDEALEIRRNRYRDQMIADIQHSATFGDPFKITKEFTGMRKDKVSHLFKKNSRVSVFPDEKAMLAILESNSIDSKTLIEMCDKRRDEQENRLFGAEKIEPAPTILDKAQAIVYGDRESSYGPPRKNWEDIAAAWNAYFDSIKMRSGVLVNTQLLEQKDFLDTSFRINAQDAACMMALLKIMRLATNQGHEDSLLDLAGYTAVIERIKTNA